MPRIPVEIITRNIKNPDESPRFRIINHGEDSDRRWLGKHSYWAIRNGFSTTSRPLTREEFESIRHDPIYQRPERS